MFCKVARWHYKYGPVACEQNINCSATYCAGTYGKVVSWRTPSRVSPSQTSLATMAGPLSLMADRGKPLRIKACDTVCTRFCAHSAPQYHCRWETNRERSSMTPNNSGVAHSPREVRILREPQCASQWTRPFTYSAS